MTVFAVIGQHQTQKLKQAITNLYPQDSYLLAEGTVWLISDQGSAQDIANKLQISDGTNGSAVILEIGGYFGRANPNIWAWIKTKWESGSRG